MNFRRVFWQVLPQLAPIGSTNEQTISPDERATHAGSAVENSTVDRSHSVAGHEADQEHAQSSVPMWQRPKNETLF